MNAKRGKNTPDLKRTKQGKDGKKFGASSPKDKPPGEKTKAQGGGGLSPTFGWGTKTRKNNNLSVLKNEGGTPKKKRKWYWGLSRGVLTAGGQRKKGKKEKKQCAAKNTRRNQTKRKTSTKTEKKKHFENSTSEENKGGDQLKVNLRGQVKKTGGKKKGKKMKPGCREQT